MKRIILPLIVSSLFLPGSAAFAAQPVANVNPAVHPNIASAQRFSQQAYEQIVIAQKANGWDMEGHAQKAKDLLTQVNSELKMAAEAANKKR